MLLAHGPHWPMFFMTPLVANAGGTWDVAPVAMNALCGNQFTYPGVFTTPKERFDEVPYQVPFLEFADEGATRCRMVSNRILVEGVTRGNPWSAFGPLEPRHSATFGQAIRISTSTRQGHAECFGAPGVFEGPLASLFTEEFTFKKPVTLNAFGYGTAAGTRRFRDRASCWQLARAHPSAM